MPSFILRNLDPEFWARVQAKAAAEGQTVKTVILRLLASWLAAVLLLATVACGYKNPTAPEAPVVPPAAGVPARIELSANPGQGTEAGTGTITARVLDGLSGVVPNQTVHFVASAGTLSAPAAVTDGSGVARAAITGTPGDGITITATVGSVQQKTMIAIQAPPPAPPVNTPPVLPPPVAPTPPPAPAPAPLPQFSVVLTNNLSSVPETGVIDFFATVTNPGGEVITAYQWDLDGDGDFEFTTIVPNKQSGPMAADGLFTATVKVTTASGRTATGTAKYVVTNG